MNDRTDNRQNPGTPTSADSHSQVNQTSDDVNLIAAQRNSIAFPPLLHARPLAQTYCELGQTLLFYGKERRSKNEIELAKRRFGQAAQAFLDAVREQGGAEPGPTAVLNIYLAQAREAQERHEDALRAYLQAVLLRPTIAGQVLPSAHRLVNQQLARSISDIANKLEETAGSPELDKNTSSAILNFLGRVCLFRAEYNSAVSLFEEALRKNPRSIYIREGLAEALWRTNEVERALRVIGEAVQQADRRGDSERMAATRLQYATYLFDVERYPEAKQVAEVGLLHSEALANDLNLVLGRCSLGLGESGAAAQYAGQVLSSEIHTDKQIVEAQVIRAEVQYREGQYQDAADTALTALEIESTHLPAIRLRGLALIAGHLDPEQGIKLLQLYSERGQTDTAAAAWEEITKNQPDNALAHLNLARALFELGDPVRSLGVIDRVWNISPTGEIDMDAIRLKGQILVALDRPVGEITDFFYRQGLDKKSAQDYAAAIDLFALAVEQDESFSPAYWNRVESLRMWSYQTQDPAQDRALISEGLSVWERAESKSLIPESSESWAYVTRALLNLKSEHLPPKKRRWEGILYLERAVLLNEWNAMRWAALGYYFRLLNLEANALHATAKALEYGSEDLWALDERAAILANTGQFDEAKRIVEKRLKIEPNSWTRAVLAYVLKYLGQYEKALENISEDTDVLWEMSERATCLWMLGKHKEAIEAYGRLWKAYDAQDRDNQGYYADAAFSLGVLTDDPSLIETAMDIYSQLTINSDDDVEVIGARLGLGYGYLYQGRLKKGEEAIIDVIPDLTNERQIDGVLKFDLLPLKESLPQGPAGIETKDWDAVFERIQAFAETRRKELEQLSTEEKELDELEENELQTVIADLDREEDADRIIRAGALAGLARLHRAKGRWEQAAKVYNELALGRQRFPETRQGFKKAIDGLQSKGDNDFKKLEIESALGNYHKALALKADSRDGDAISQVRLQARVGLCHFYAGDREKAHAGFRKVLESSGDGLEPGSALGDVARSLLTDVRHYWLLDAELEAFAGKADALREAIATARRSLAGYLNDYFQLAAETGDTRYMSLLVTPIALEIARDLAPAEDEEDEWTLTSNYAPEMRERLQQRMGVRVPSIRVRTNEAGLSPGSYTIMLDEVVVASGTVQVGQYYCTASKETLNERGIPYGALSPATNPATGAPGCWVNPEYESRIVEQGLELWTDHQLFLMYHLEAVLCANLTSFVGVQEVANLVETWEQEEGGVELIAEVLPDVTARLRFGRVLHALLKEQVTIAPWQEILEAVRAAGLKNDDVREAVRAVRLRLKSHLPGNAPSAERVEAPESFESGISSFLRPLSGTLILDIPPEEMDRLLTEIREFLRPYSEYVVLIARDPTVRPFIRQLVALEFTRVMVISKEELLPTDEMTAAWSL